MLQGWWCGSNKLFSEKREEEGKRVRTVRRSWSGIEMVIRRIEKRENVNRGKSKTFYIFWRILHSQDQYLLWDKNEEDCFDDDIFMWVVEIYFCPGVAFFFFFLHRSIIHAYNFLGNFKVYLSFFFFSFFLCSACWLCSVYCRHSPKCLNFRGRYKYMSKKQLWLYQCWLCGVIGMLFWEIAEMYRKQVFL